MADVTGIPVPTGASPFRPAEDMQAMADRIGAPEMFSVATAANLPAADNWDGRRLLARDKQRWYTWVSSSWVGERVIVTGSVACPASGGGGAAPVYWSDLIDVSFPAGVFSSPPRVMVETIGPAGQVPAGAMVEQITTTGCKVRGYRIGSVPSSAFSVQWVAVSA